MLLLSFTKTAVSVLILLWLKAKCLLKNYSVYRPTYIEFQLLHFLGRHKTSVKFVAKIAHLFMGQIDPLIILGRGILHFIVGLAQWYSLAQTLCYMLQSESIHNNLFLPKINRRK